MIGSSTYSIISFHRLGKWHHHGHSFSSTTSLTTDERVQRGTGAWFPSKFQLPQNYNNDGLFKATAGTRCPHPRFTRISNPKEVLIFTDGACLNNGQANPEAGWAFHNKPGSKAVSGRLEERGPFGAEAPQTSNRAELRAVIAALGFRAWDGEGFSRLVIATDSSYVVDGATKWTQIWMKNEWQKVSGGPVANRDLWELLLGEVERWHKRHVEILFWKISRSANLEADRAAKEAAQKADVAEYQDIIGIMA